MARPKTARRAEVWFLHRSQHGEGGYESHLRITAAGIAVVTLVLLPANGGTAPPAAGMADTIKPRPATPELLALGKKVYEKQCAACHGLDGRGNGEAAYLLYLKPRDFVAARYRQVSTWERVPTDED